VTASGARGGTEAAAGTLASSRIYQSAWRAHDPQGNPFGDLFFIYIQVEPLPTPQPYPGGLACCPLTLLLY